MELSKHTRILGAFVALVLYSVGGCRMGDSRRDERAVAEAIFAQPGHKLDDCAKQLAESHRSFQDGLLFFEKDTRILVKPPRLQGCESYHAHLIQRVGGHEIEQLFIQGADTGVIEIPLDRYEEPEALVITSSAIDFRQKEVPSPVAKAAPGAKPEEGIAPPYIVSYKLLPWETAPAIISLQAWRYDISTRLGPLHVFPQSLNRTDQLVTLVDSTKRLTGIMEEDPYIAVAKYKSAIIPRLSVEVRDKAGKVWEKSGTWHVPTGLDRFFKPGEQPFLLRTDEQELIAFSPPPCVEVSFPDGAPGTSARVAAKFSGLRDGYPLKFVLGSVYPAGPRGEWRARVETHEVTSRTTEATYTASLEGLPPEAFPVTASITHRLVQPWRLTGGRYEPQEPAGKAVLPPLEKGKPRTGPSHLIFARFASHYDFLLFLGDGQGKGRKSSLVDSYYAPGGNDSPPSSNMLPPVSPPGGGGPPPIIILPPPGNNGGGGGGPGGGGGDSDCGCGPRGAGCPNSNGKCGGHCGNCKCQGQQDGAITVNMPCGTPGIGCQPPQQCTCGQHTWSENDLMASVTAQFPHAAETAWFGDRTGIAGCDVTTPVARVRVTYWGNGLQQINQWYTISVAFGPCTPNPPPPPPPQPPKKPKEEGEKRGNNGGGGGFGVFNFSGSATPGIAVVTTTANVQTQFQNLTTMQFLTHPYNDPNMAIRGLQISIALGGMGQIGASVIVSSSLFDPGTLAQATSMAIADIQDFVRNYWSSAPGDTFTSTLSGDLASFWAKPIRPPAPPSGGGTSSGTSSGTTSGTTGTGGSTTGGSTGGTSS